MPREPLPIDPFLDGVVAALRVHRAVVVTAHPGAGKTTRVAPALTREGPVILLQPRRVAARAIARRIAEEQAWTIGREVGWQVRFERRFGPDTRLLVVTEGILTARLQLDPLLSEFRTVVVDEFHERSIHADLGLALARQAWLAREDLRLVVMSATLETAPVSSFLGGCPVIEVPGRLHPLDVSYASGESVPDAVAHALGATAGQVLCFLPGAPEIRRAQLDVERRVAGRAEVVPLHGSLDAPAQDDAIRPADRRRVILATNIAETSLTVPGVTAVIDTGWHKVARYDPDRGIDSLDTERITQDSADQRGGRAGRLGPGIVRRLWDARDRLRPHREPDVARIDLAAAALDLIAWGADPRRFEWFELPPREAVDAALELLVRLGAIESDRGRPGPAPTGALKLTALGDQMRRLPLHPRLGRILIAAGGAREAAAACALLSERHFFTPRTASTTCDLLSIIDDWRSVPPHVRRVTDEIERMAARLLGHAKQAHAGDVRFRRSLLAGYPDRVARRRAAGSPRVVLASGHGAVVSEESGVRGGELVLAIDVQAGWRGEGSEARIRVASQVDEAWLTTNRTTREHRFDERAGRVKAFEVDWYDDLRLAERPVAVDPAVAAEVLAGKYGERGFSAADRRLLARARFAGLALDTDDLVRRACAGASDLREIDLAAHLPFEMRRSLDRLAPETLPVPSGRSARLEYDEDGHVSVSVKLQELFGLAETPRIGPARKSVTIELLAPNGRPVQVTSDLRSFWDRVYPEIRPALRARYPKHPWPKDPWSATPTARTVRRQGRGRATR